MVYRHAVWCAAIGLGLAAHAIGSTAAAAMVPAPRASPSEPPQPSARSLTLLLPAPDSGLDPKLIEAIGEHSQSVGLQVEPAPTDLQRGPLAQAQARPASPDSVGVFWLSARADGVAVYLYEPRRRVVFIREVRRGADDSDAVLVDAVGVIVASTAAALQRRGEIGMRRAEADDLESQVVAPATDVAPACPAVEPRCPSPAADRSAEPSVPAINRPPLLLSAGLGYFGESFDRHAPWQSGVLGQLSIAPHRLVRVGAGYGFLAPTSRPTLEFDIWRHELGAHLGVGGSVTTRVAVRGTAVVGLQLVRWRSVQGDGLRPLLRAGPGAELSIAIVPGLTFDVGLGAVATLTPFSLLACEGTTTDCEPSAQREVARPWPIAPRATVGLRTTIDLRAR